MPRLLVYLLSAALAPRSFTADVNGYFEAARQLRWDFLPYRDFLWEYPPVAGLALLLGPVAFGSREVFVGSFATVMIGMDGAAERSMLAMAGALDGEIAIPATPRLIRSCTICTSPASSELSAGPV